jgi:ubiquinone/menaquinone biosynthesis C-methylase UbiE
MDRIQDNKRHIIKDFELKHKSYFENNYQRETPFNRIRRERLSLFKRHIATLMPPRKILDVGCGPMILFPEALNSCEQYIALDMSLDNLKQIGSTMTAGKEKVSLVQADMDSLPLLKGEYFDLIVCSGSIEYTNSPRSNLLILEELLSPGGTLICSFPNRNNYSRIWTEYVYRYLARIRYLFMQRSVHGYTRYLFTVRQIENWLHERNRDSIEWVRFGGCFLPSPFDKLLPFLDSSICNAIDINGSLMGRVLSTEFLMILKK